MTAPILLVTWKRPLLTAQVIDALRRAGPSRVYVFSDGPRGKEDEGLVKQTRDLIQDQLDWNCEAFWFASERNLGCERGVSSAISWFFSQEPEGIILEDDCVPGPDFLEFATQMLERFRDSEEVFSIVGDNSLGLTNGRDSYSFIRFPHTWGWASWRRAWANYDPDMTAWKGHRSAKRNRKVFVSSLERKLWTRNFDRVASGSHLDTWDWQWAAAHYMNSGLAVQPHRNLVTNIGFGSDATHTTGHSPRADKAPQPVFPLSHPKDVALTKRVARQAARNTVRLESGNFVARARRYLAGSWLR